MIQCTKLKPQQKLLHVAYARRQKMLSDAVDVMLHNIVLRKCQKAHKEHHSAYCGHIAELEKLEKCKVYGNKTVHQRQDDLRLRRKIMKLLGRSQC